MMTEHRPNSREHVQHPPVLRLEGAVMIAWAKESYRSTATARTFGAKIFLIPGTERKGPIAKLGAYVANARKTLAILRCEKPRIIFCINLPVVLPLVCTAYAIFSHSRVVMDFHSGALSSRKWRYFTFAYRWIARRAPFTICHNRVDGDVVASWGAHVVHLLTLPQGEFPGHARRRRPGRPLFFFSCSFASDEPIALAIAAMASCPEYDFVISGNYRKHGLDQSAMPSNVALAGFMPYDDYLKTMAESTAVLTLSTRQHIMQMAVHEAITIEIPVIANDSAVLREVLGDAAVFCSLSKESLATAFHTAADRHLALATRIRNAKFRAFAHITQELEQANRYLQQG